MSLKDTLYRVLLKHGIANVGLARELATVSALYTSRAMRRGVVKQTRPPKLPRKDS